MSHDLPQAITVNEHNQLQTNGLLHVVPPATSTIPTTMQNEQITIQNTVQHNLSNTVQTNLKNHAQISMQSNIGSPISIPISENGIVTQVSEVIM